MKTFAKVQLLWPTSPLSAALGLGLCYPTENAFGGPGPGRLCKGAGEKPS